MDAQDVDLEQLRRYLFAIAYRMLGSASDAEDIVQVAYLRWQGADQSSICSPKAYLSAVVTRRLIGLALKVYAGVAPTYEPLNGGMGVLLWRGEQLLNATVATVADGRIQALHSVLNPRKLAYLRQHVSPPVPEGRRPSECTARRELPVTFHDAQSSTIRGALLALPRP